MICAIVLAAGESRRMGTQKLLLPWAGKTVIEQVVNQLQISRINHLWVVTGHDHDRLKQTLSDYPVKLIYNEDYRQGMLSSVRCGLKALPEDCTGVLVALGDQPSLQAHTVNLLLDQFMQHPAIVLPVYQNRRGHPLLFSPAYCQKILTGYNSVGLRGLLQEHENDVLEVTVSSAAVLADLNTPDDYQEQTEDQNEKGRQKIFVNR
jgi:molybdenum cofactor cytidylyltransferase